MRFAVLLVVAIIAPSVLWAASHHPQAFLEDVRGKPDEGAQIVGHFCAVCHAPKPQIPLGAPRQGIQADWQARLQQGLDVMWANTAEGMNAMPPRGGCFECSDEQLRKAIIALLPEESRTQVARELEVDKKHSVPKNKPGSAR
ncbi:MAG: cytochrome c5 family protein [Legionellaceae bacterium]|nr:cytochrome c5 family protein [Legionellaceae bacterium]